MLTTPVSILARPEGQALHEYLLVQRADVYVSILARPEGQALLDAHERLY
jgi:hypothetical protein